MLVSLGLSGLALYNQGRLAARQPRRWPGAAPPPPASALQHVGVVRFNPYHDTGGDYSFAVALLDGGGSGVVLTGLYHRDLCRVYAKPVRSWQSSYPFTDEEQEAVSQARAAPQ